MSDVQSFPATLYVIPSRRPEGANHLAVVVHGNGPGPALTICNCEAGKRGNLCWAQLEAVERHNGTYEEPAPAWAIMLANGAR